MNNEYIAHHGIKGMKWGVRRARPHSGGSGSEGPRKPAKTADDYKRMKSTVDKTASYVETGKKTKAKIDKKRNNDKIKKDLESMSDKELQQVVNRLNMEERYSAVMNSRYSSNGKDRINRILDNAGTALAIGSSALSIMIAMKELQK